MKAFLFSFLALGLAGVFAAPAPAPESALDARAQCTLVCKVGYTAVYSLTTRRCKCVLNDEEICLRETICIGTHHPVWDSSTKSCSCQPYDFVAEENCLRETFCIATHKPTWNSATKKCSCELIVIEDPDKERCLLATSCLTGTHAFWNSKSKKCSCNPNDGEFICKAATTCSPGSTTVWHSDTESCICEKVTKREAAEEFPDPKTCPTIRCAEGTTPKYITKLGRCICETNPVDPKTCPTVRCAEGYTPKYIPGQAHCICEKNPVPTTADAKTCPTIKCSAGYKPQYNSSTKSCSCVPDPTQCTGLVCIAEMRPVYDEKTKQCSCQWIPGLEPSQVSSRAPTAIPAPTDPCADILCIAEMTPKVNDQGICHCEYIPGLEPGAPTTPADKREAAAAPGFPSALQPTCTGYCISEQYLAYNPVTKKCECQWIKGLEPGGPYADSKSKTKRDAGAEPVLPSALNPTCKGYCISEQHLVYNPVTKKCECQWIKGLEPGGPTVDSKSKAKRDAEANPQKYPPPSTNPGCEGILCIAEKHPVYNPTTKICSCEWIKGFGPLRARKAKAQVMPRPEPFDPFNCRYLKVYCEGGDHHMVYDVRTKKCMCPLVAGGSAGDN